MFVGLFVSEIEKVQVLVCVVPRLPEYTIARAEALDMLIRTISVHEVDTV